jgi:hypothetical protein
MDRRLPDQLSEMPASELEAARSARDDRLTSLFRRWPRLDATERRELKRLYTERIRIARYLGTLRRRISTRR